MNKHLLLTFLVWTVVFTSSAQIRLRVEGDAIITGKLQLSQAQNDSSVVIGTDVGPGSTTNGTNVFIGARAGRINTGFQNVFLGHAAGEFNNNAFNTYVGYEAGRFDDLGYSNTFVGTATGRVNNTGRHNTFLGWAAGRSNTDGNLNVFVGSNSGQSNQTGENNTFLGYSAGGFNTSGSNNVFVGIFAGNNNETGYENTFLGFLAGSANEGGNNNTYIGRNAGANITDGNRSTFLGANATQLGASGLDRAIAIGHEAKVNCSNCAVIGGTGVEAVKLGIGTATPRGALHILTTGAPPTGLNSSENGLLMGVQSTTGYKWIQSYGGALVLNSEGNNVGINTALPTFPLEVNGGAAKPGGGDWTNSASDGRLKSKVRPYEDGLDKLLQIRPVWYQYNGKAGLPTGKDYVGIIAQEMRTIAPYTVGTFDHQGASYLNYDGSAIRYMIINAIKELHAEVEQKEDHITALEHENQELRDRLEKLEASVQQLLEVQTPADTGDNYSLELNRPASLAQNQPNPFDQQTLIQYYVPADVKTAAIRITAVDGRVLRHLKIREAGSGELSIKTQGFPAGTYYYSLVLDGQLVETRSMVIR